MPFAETSTKFQIDMNYFVITSTREVIEEVEGFFKSWVLSERRSIRLGGTTHYPTYSTAQIVAVPDEGLIDPTDIFWLGHFSKKSKP